MLLNSQKLLLAGERQSQMSLPREDKMLQAMLFGAGEHRVMGARTASTTLCPAAGTAGQGELVFTEP